MVSNPSSDLATDDRVCVRSLITGRVQGVGYRYNTRLHAIALGLVGWVRNLPDGRVEAIIEGDPTQIAKMVEWLHTGPPAAEVSSVETEDQPLQQFSAFEIRR